MGPKFSPIKQLARVAHPASSRMRYLAVIAYFDESGKLDTPVISFGAIVASEKKWARFEQQWGRVLRRHRIKVFHATDFQSNGGEFRNKDWSDAKKAECSSNLVSAINGTIEYGVTVSIVVNDWKEFMWPVQVTSFKKKRGLSIFLLQICLEAIHQETRLPKGEKISCVFDRDHFLEPAMRGHYRRLFDVRKWNDVFNSAIAFANKAEIIPLQAADLVAYTGFKHAQNQIMNKDQIKPRKSLDVPLARKRFDVMLVDKPYLKKLQDHTLDFLIQKKSRSLGK